MLKKEGIPHSVLNAKYHEKEAMIIKDAGQYKAVTIATNMAGRGVDIKLGKGVKELGGLFILGTERHEARRIDNQLRGRSGRQGDPGESQFYLSLEDELLRIFGGDSIKRILSTLKIPEDEPIQHKLLSRQIENAQKKVEAYNFSIRKNLLDYDNVLDKQREIIYKERDKILKGGSVHDEIVQMVREVTDKIVLSHYNEDIGIQEEEIDELEKSLSFLINRKVTLDREAILSMRKEELLEELEDVAIKAYEEKISSFGEQLKDEIEKYILLRTIDSNWKDHLYAMDDLKEGIGLRAYGQQDPLIAYQIEGHQLFDEMIERVKEDTVRTLFKIEIRSNEENVSASGQSETHTMNNEENKLSKEERKKRRALKKKLKKKRKR